MRGLGAGWMDLDAGWTDLDAGGTIVLLAVTTVERNYAQEKAGGQKGSSWSLALTVWPWRHPGIPDRCSGKRWVIPKSPKDAFPISTSTLSNLQVVLHGSLPARPSPPLASPPQESLVKGQKALVNSERAPYGTSSAVCFEPVASEVGPVHLAARFLLGPGPL